jgi:hypothetical protein
MVNDVDAAPALFDDASALNAADEEDLSGFSWVRDFDDRKEADPAKFPLDPTDGIFGREPAFEFDEYLRERPVLDGGLIVFSLLLKIFGSTKNSFHFIFCDEIESRISQSSIAAASASAMAFSCILACDLAATS